MPEVGRRLPRRLVKEKKLLPHQFSRSPLFIDKDQSKGNGFNPVPLRMFLR